MISSGRFDPLPRSRATRLGRFGSAAKTWFSIFSASRMPLRYATAGTSLPGGSLVSIRTSVWKWRIVSSSTAGQFGVGASAERSRATTTNAIRNKTRMIFIPAKKPMPAVESRTEARGLGRIGNSFQGHALPTKRALVRGPHLKLNGQQALQRQRLLCRQRLRQLAEHDQRTERD